MRHRSQTVLLIATVLMLVATACGTRLPDKAFDDALRVQSGTGSRQGGTNGTTNGGDVSGDTTGTGTDNGTTAGTGGSTGGTGGSTGGTAAGTTGGSTGGTTGGKAAPGNTASDTGITPTTITLGNVTSVGGALGPDAFGVTLRGIKVWVAATNDRGGVNGRKIVLKTCDDRSDGPSHLSCTQQLNERDKIFALVANNSDASARSANYEYKNNLPDLGFPLNNGYYKYPNMFTFYGIGYPRDGKQVGKEAALRCSFTRAELGRFARESPGADP